jgi:TonB family protein
MKTIPRPAALLSIIFILATAGLAQTKAPPPTAPGGIHPNVILVEAWEEFRHEAGNFAVMMPGKPLEMSQTVESEIGKIPIYSFTAPGGTLTYLAMYAEYPISIDTSEAAKISLDNARDLLLSKRNGKLISEADISFGKYPGRELKATIDGGMLRSRTYIVNKRMYLVMALAPGDDTSKQLDSKKVDDFLGSFKFLREPQPADGSAPSMSRVESEIGNFDLPPDFATRPISWREVPSPEFGFTVWMPSEPYRRKFPFNPNDRRLDINLWMARGTNSLYQMMVQPLLAAPSSEEHRKIFFRTFLDGLLNSSGMKLESEKPISFEGHAGREYKLRGTAGVGTGRAYIISSNVYFLLVAPVKKPVKSEDEAAEGDRFLDSFRLTKDPDAAPAVGSVVAGSASWREITEPGHGFKVMLPGEPKRESPYSQSDSTYKLISAGDGLVCMVMRLRLPSPPAPQYEAERFYKTFVDGFTKSGEFEIVGETNVVLDGRDGREYKLKKNEQTGVARIFLIGLDVYSISAIKVLPGASEKSISTFLDSFKLIEKSQKDELAEPPPPPPPMPRKSEAREGTVKASGGPILDKAIKKVEPDYPPIAKAAGAEGKVMVNIKTSEEGKVIEAEIIEGHPLLRDSVLKAVKQWEFKPTELSGVPVKVVAVLTFDFKLK